MTHGKKDREKLPCMAEQESRERLADVQHDIWAHWMRYLFTTGRSMPDGCYVLRAIDVDRWRRQVNTAYADLSEREKESDREQADKALAVLAEKELS